MRKVIEALASLYSNLILLPLIFCLVPLSRFIRLLNRRKRPRLVWAGAPLLSLKTTSEAMRSAGYRSETIVHSWYPTIEEHYFDIFVESKRRFPFGMNALVAHTRAAILFCRSLFVHDVMHGFFNGAILARTPLANLEYRLWKLSGGRLVLMPYGSDSFVYEKLPETPWANALRNVYPKTKAQDDATACQLDSYSRHADAVVGCIVHNYCLPKIDYLPVLWYPYDQSLVVKDNPITDRLVVAHATNHREIKGTDALEAAVTSLQSRGLNIDLILVENASHEEVLKAFGRADIVVDQLLFGYAMAALEGMALGKVVISGFDNSEMYQVFRDSSYLGECPIIQASPNTIEAVLMSLSLSRDDLIQIKKNNKLYIEKHHSYSATVALFEKVYFNFINS
jgi:hypothetical protein